MPDTIETLLVIAADSEVTAACRLFDAKVSADAQSGAEFRVSPSVWVLQTGIGKANAAARVARVLATTQVARVINLGVAGSLPSSGLHIGQAIIASRSVFADEGLDTPNGFIDGKAMGFPIYQEDDGAGLPPDQELADRLGYLDLSEAVVATVSTCSGRDELATQIRRRTGAAAEAMEGAAAMLACRYAQVPAAEIRVISNTTGDRDAQIWDIGLALTRLGELSRRLSDIDLN